MPPSDRAIVLLVGSRFYSGRSKSGRLSTAWSLAGAKLFGEWDVSGIEQAERLIAQRRKPHKRIVVRIEVCE